MRCALLDVNVLLAIVWSSHIHSSIARRWLAANKGTSWATCPLTEAGFVRLTAQPQIIGSRVSVLEAISALDTIRTFPGHTFWPRLSSLTELLPEIRERLAGHRQVTDALLLDLAIRQEGRLVTLDRSVGTLLAADSSARAALEIIPTE